MVELEARGHVLRRHRRPPRVGVQQQQRLVVALDAAINHVLPLGADLRGRDKKREVCITSR